MDEQLRAQIEAWAAQDPDEDTRAELARLVAGAEAGEAAALEELASAFAGPLAFGTAGLRAAMGPGPARMNRVVVTRASAGLAAWLAEEAACPAGSAVLVGYDARHKSARFAQDTAEVLTAAGFAPLLSAGPVPTPLIAFGLKHLGCAAAVQVTASHNPAADNGYKVYNRDGSQIIPPMDAQIADHIADLAAHPVSRIARSSAYATIGEDLIEAYVAQTAALVADATSHDVVWAYTAMHGVGHRVVQQVTQACGFPDPALVAEQIEPDPDFPTVAFPNPEEPGAIDGLMALAEDVGADIAIATDPDADRCGVAIPVGGTWRRLSGDEIGALLADDAMRRQAGGRFACSIVSSTLLQTMCQARGREFVPTLTGFKWIGRVPGLVFGYEEAIGYCCDPRQVADKDGISATAVLLRLTAELKAAGSSLADRLDEIDATFGAHTTRQVGLRVEHLSQIAEMMARVRTRPPTHLAGQAVTARDWLLEPADGLIATDALEFTGASVHAVVRPSGTEPKLKCYLEARATPAQSQADLAGVRRRNEARLDELWAGMAVALGAS